MDRMQPAARQYRGDEPLSGGMKALMVIISILLCPIGSLIAWVYGARNADKPGAVLVRLVGMIFTVISIMGWLVLGAAVLTIPGFLDRFAAGQDASLAGTPVVPPPAAAAAARSEQAPAAAAGAQAIQVKQAELRAYIGQAVAAYYTENKKYPTLEELKAAGLLDERFDKDPAHPEEGYLVQVITWTKDGKPGCNVNVEYIGAAAPGMDIADAAADALPGNAGLDQAGAGGTPAAEAAPPATPGAAEQAPPAHHNSGKRGAARWKQFM